LLEGQYFQIALDDPVPKGQSERTELGLGLAESAALTEAIRSTATLKDNILILAESIEPNKTLLKKLRDDILDVIGGRRKRRGGVLGIRRK
jgi:hypothetical protein